MSISQSVVVSEKLFNLAKTGRHCNLILLGTQFFEIDEMSVANNKWSELVSSGDEKLPILVTQVKYKRIFRLTAEELYLFGEEYKWDNDPNKHPYDIIIKILQQNIDETVDENSLVSVIEFYCFTYDDIISDCGIYS